jgi:hypothetical protein
LGAGPVGRAKALSEKSPQIHQLITHRLIDKITIVKKRKGQVSLFEPSEQVLSGSVPLFFLWVDQDRAFALGNDMEQYR